MNESLLVQKTVSGEAESFKVLSRSYNAFMTKVYGWMSAGLAVTALIAWLTVNNGPLLRFIVSNPLVFWGLIIAEFVCVIALSAAVKKMSAEVASYVFIAYAGLNGLTFSVIFLVYTFSSIALTFLITAGTFGAMAFYGSTTKRDLTSVGNIAFMGLIGLILASVANYFFQNPAIYWITSYAGVLIFTALTAYDVQKIKRLNVLGNEGTDEDKKEAIIGALTLYLDFINLFLSLLRIFGRRRD